MNLASQSSVIIDAFSEKAEPEFLTLIIDDLIVDKLIHDCHFIIDINNQMYRTQLYHYIECRINYQKQKNEKKLFFARCFYSLCSDTDILDKIIGN
jgi:hypothetical protein